jgi:hypothetical protein
LSNSQLLYLANQLHPSRRSRFLPNTWDALTCSSRVLLLPSAVFSEARVKCLTSKIFHSYVDYLFYHTALSAPIIDNLRSNESNNCAKRLQAAFIFLSFLQHFHSYFTVHALLLNSLAICLFIQGLLSLTIFHPRFPF